MKEPYAWLYENASGVRVLHIVGECDEMKLLEDMRAAENYPLGHSMKALYDSQQWTEDQIADACYVADIRDGLYESLMIALKEAN